METDKLRELHGDKGITSPYEQWALTLDPNSKYYDEIYSMGVYNTIYTDDRYAKYRDENHMYNTEKPEDSYAVFNFPKLSQKEYNWDIQKYKKENYNLDWNKPGPGHSYGQITYTDPADGKVYIINPVDNPEHRENIYALVKDGTFDLDYDGKERKFLEDGGISIGDITLSEIKVTPSEPKIPWYKFKERHKKEDLFRFRKRHVEKKTKKAEEKLIIQQDFINSQDPIPTNHLDKDDFNDDMMKRDLNPFNDNVLDQKAKRPKKILKYLEEQYYDDKHLSWRIDTMDGDKVVIVTDVNFGTEYTVRVKDMGDKSSIVNDSEVQLQGLADWIDNSRNNIKLVRDGEDKNIVAIENHNKDVLLKDKIKNETFKFTDSYGNTYEWDNEEERRSIIEELENKCDKAVQNGIWRDPA